MGNTPFCVKHCLRKDAYDQAKVIEYDRPELVSREVSRDNARDVSRGTPSEHVPLVADRSRTQSGRTHHCCSCKLVCCIFLFLLVLAVWGVAPFVFGYIMGRDQFLMLSPRVHEYIFDGLNPASIPEYIWWPGCTQRGNKTTSYLQSCALPCYSPELIPEIERFNEQHPYKQVTFPSRPDASGRRFNLTGWWLPGDVSNLPAKTTAPRVVITHGFTSNSNKWISTLAAYYMRSLGFSVLLNNLEDHGYSQNTSNSITTWGYSYHYDVLGAWDYLKADPNGILGGPAPASKVGIMGFSMGAFVTLNAFTLDGQIPAAWVDSPLSSPKDAFFYGARQMMVPNILLKIPGIDYLTWFWLNFGADVDINDRTPLKDLPTVPDGVARPLQVVANGPDKTTPLAGVEEIAELARKYPKKYAVQAPYYTVSTCNNKDHLVTALLEPTTYRNKLCVFWTTAFATSTSMCGLDKLKQFNVSRRLVSAKDLDATMSDVNVFV